MVQDYEGAREILEDFFPLEHRYGLLACKAGIETIATGVVQDTLLVDLCLRVAAEFKPLVKKYGIEQFQQVWQMAEESGRFVETSVLSYDSKDIKASEWITIFPHRTFYGKCKSQWEFRKLQETNSVGKVEQVLIMHPMDQLEDSPLDDFVKTIRRLKEITVGSQNSENRWKFLVISAPLAQDGKLKDFLAKEEGISIFQGIKFESQALAEGNEDDGIETRWNGMDNDLLKSLIPRFQRNDFEALDFDQCPLSNDNMRVLRKILDSLCLRELRFTDVSFEDPTFSSKILAEYLASPPNALNDESPVYLERLELNLSGSICNWTIDDIRRMIRSLRGNKHVKSLQINDIDESMVPILLCLAEELLCHDDCYLESIRILPRIMDQGDEMYETYYSPGCPPLWNALLHNTSLRNIEISNVGGRRLLHPDDVVRIVQLLFSPAHSIKSFKARRLVSLQSVIQAAFTMEANMMADGPVGGNTDLEDRYHQCRIRTFLMHVDRDADFAAGELCALSRLLERCLPYLYDVRLVHHSSERNGRKRVITELTEKSEDDEELCDEIALWMERNQVGRALLHRSVVGRVPMSLWTTVLHKAVSCQSVLYSERDYGKRPPLDGLYYLVQNLLLGGPLEGQDHSKEEAKPKISCLPLKRLAGSLNE